MVAFALIPHAGLSLCLVPGIARPSAQSHAASPLRPDQQVPLPGFSAFLAHPANSPSSCPALTFCPSRGIGHGTMASADSCVLSPTSRWGLPSWAAWPQVSPGKNVDFPCTLAPFTAPPFDRIGLHCLWPARPSGTASDGVRVPQVAGLPPASSRPRLAATPLPSASGWCNQPPQRSFTA